ncbi:MAG: putative chitobiose transport system permease protein [Candidatus Sumerlaeota bacterium]|nr:putative chitobiose transport system permease protein [Candidatus Sumerlaeota bacterium]
MTPYASPAKEATGFVTYSPAAKRRPGRIALRVLHYVVLILLIFVFIGPFLWMASISIRPSNESIYTFDLIPEAPTLEFYATTWTEYSLDRAFLNSLIVTVASVVSNVLLCSWAAYPLARMAFRGKQLVFLLILSTMMVPFQLYMIPLFLISLKLGLFDTLLGVIVPSTVGAFGIYLLRQYYQSIPKDLEEAARIDGAGEFQIWAKIMFPLTKPAVVTLAIFVFVQTWSSFLWPLIITNSEERYTLPVAVARLSGDFIGETQFTAAGSVIAVLPIIILFALLQRWFIGGMTMGSVKG